MRTKKKMEKDAERLRALREMVNEELRNAELAKEAIMIAEKYRRKADMQRIMLDQLQNKERTV